MTRIMLLPGCDPRAFVLARDAIGTTAPEVLRSGTALAVGLGRTDHLRLDWHGVQILYSGMGASVATGYEPVRIRAEIRRILDEAIAHAVDYDRDGAVIEEMGRMSRFALMDHDGGSRYVDGSTVAISPTPMSAGFCYGRSSNGFVTVTADASTMRRWMPDLAERIVVRSATHDDGVSRIVMEPLAGHLPVEAIDPVERLRLHSRFGS